MFSLCCWAWAWWPGWSICPFWARALPGAKADTATPAGKGQVRARLVIKDQYALALAEYYAGEYARAQVLFSGIRDRVPGYLTDDIKFWRAECAFRLGDLRSAEAGFREFLDQGGRGPRAEIAVNRLKLLKTWGG